MRSKVSYQSACALVLFMISSNGLKEAIFSVVYPQNCTEDECEDYFRVSEGFIKEQKITFEALTRDKSAKYFVARMQLSDDTSAFYAALNDFKAKFKTFDVNLLSKELLNWSSDPQDTRRALFLFDLDSTLIDMEGIDEVAKYAGVYDQEITRRAMEGELDFQQSFRKRVALLKGLQTEELWPRMKQLAEELLNPGIRDLVARIRSFNKPCYFAIVSGGMMPIAEHIRTLLSFDFCLSNVLEVDADGKLTGGIIGDIVDATMKRDTLINLIRDQKVDPNLTVAVGDGANDLLMINTAAFGVAFCAKPIVQAQAKIHLNQADLSLLLPILGLGPINPH